MRLDPSDPALKRFVGRTVGIAIVVPLLLFVMLDLGLSVEPARCGAGRSTMIEVRGSQHCVGALWAFVDALNLPWMAMIFALILIGNLRPRLQRWRRGKRP